MTTYIDTKIVSLTSQSATINYNSSFLSNVRYNLGLIIRNQPNIIHRQVQLLNAQIPYSFYVVNYTNNLFKTNILGSIVTYTIPPGNYNANNLITTILSVLGNPTGLTLSISSITGKLTFTYTSNFTIYNNFQYSIGSILGFVANSNSTSVSNILIGTYPLNLLGIKSLQVRSSNLIMDNISSVQGGQTTLLSTIPVSAVPFGMIDYVDKGNHLMTIYNEALDDLDIDIVDGESGELINFNGQEWCITLAFHVTYLLNIPTKVIPELNKTDTTIKEKTEKPNPDLSRTTVGQSPLEQLNILNKTFSKV
jgi:hypothetical protein